MYTKEVPNTKKSAFVKFIIFLSFILTLTCSPQYGRFLVFPFDHGPHFDVNNEWWYFTGEVLTPEDKSFGFEFTIFKRRLSESDDFAFLGHVAISDPEASEHFFVEVPTTHAVPDIEEGKAEINVDNFSYIFTETEGFSIKAETESLSIDLSLIPTMNVLPHGQDGIIIMGDGIPSYYYSFTNLQTSGSILVNGLEYEVSSGRTWMDHQWGNYTLFGVIWDWFSLRLDDGGALMLFQFRNAFDRVVRSNWTFRNDAGRVEYGQEISVQATRTYQDEDGKCTYPLDWIVDISTLDATFSITPLFDAQCLYDVITPDYWEGLCSVIGTMRDETVTGSAYVELTGYQDRNTIKGSPAIF
jgi:predicted secreted hydrolase